MKSTHIIIFVTLALCGCKKDDAGGISNPAIIENQTFNNTTLIDGHDRDGTLIRNCIFEDITGDGLQIRDVNELVIENCTFRNISKNAIRFRNSGSSDRVKISNNKIYNIQENGILAPENHTNTLISGNLIYNVATNNLSSQFGAPHHGIYFQGINVTITENTIHDVINDGGNGISIRTYGTLSGNRLYNAADHGISYYSDHPGDGEKLLIENNVITDNGKRGINLTGNGNAANYISEALIRFNTIVSDDHSPIGINDELNEVNFRIEGNIAIRTDGGSTFIYSNLPYSDTLNTTANGDIGFLDFPERDLHISDTSTAVNAATGLTDFPTFDFEGKPRNGDHLDTGAFAL